MTRIIDINSSLGNWPFNKVKHNTPVGMMKLMDSTGIHQACVAALEGLFYTDVQVANRHLHRGVKRFRDRLLPFSVINPDFPGWRDDLAQCDEEFRTVGLRLYPGYHNYGLDDLCCVELFAEAQQRKLPVQIVPEVSDRRMHHPCLAVGQVDLTTLPRVLREFPTLRTALLNIKVFRPTAKSFSWVSKIPLLFMDIAWLDGVAVVDDLVKAVGIDRVLFGTNAPLMIPLSSVYKLREASLDRHGMAAITERNAKRFLGKRRVQIGRKQ